MIFENIAAQMLTASGHKLYFYSKSDNEDASSRMEVDFLITKNKVTARHNIQGRKWHNLFASIYDHVFVIDLYFRLPGRIRLPAGSRSGFPPFRYRSSLLTSLRWPPSAWLQSLAWGLKVDFISV